MGDTIKIFYTSGRKRTDVNGVRLADNVVVGRVTHPIASCVVVATGFRMVDLELDHPPAPGASKSITACVREAT